ncbi:MAG: hypothetical protein HY858_15950 [Candidatus Solibacter usitatus]|nr:hypothetical protein [Candidatus Solibacter usitatus]
MLLSAVPALCQTAYHLPYIADGASGGRISRTSIVLANVGSKTANAVVTWTNDDGTPRTVGLVDIGRVSTTAVTIPPGAVRQIRTDGSGDGSAGAATVKAETHLGVSVVLSVSDASGTPIGESVVEAPEILTISRLVLDSTAGANTGFALLNPGTGAAAISATLLDSTGAKVQNTSFKLGPGGRLEAWAGSDLFPGMGELRGAIEIASSAPVAALAMRRASSSPAGVLFPVADPSSRRMKFFLPLIADGPSSGARLTTLLLVTNLGADPADVRVVFMRDDGSPLPLALSGNDAGSAFAAQLAPGASAVWETSGPGEYATGSAVIQSNQPLGVAAALRAYDEQGAVIAENGLAESRPVGLSLLPVDFASAQTAGVAAYNPTTQPITLTLTLLDSEGTSLATSQLGPVSPRGRLVGRIADLFPDAAGNGTALRIGSGGPLEGAVSVAAIREMQAGGSFASSGASALIVTGAGLTLRPTLDSSRSATALIGAAGGALSLTDAKGTKFTLTIPPKSLFGSETIRMTALTRLDGLPGGGPLSAGVQLEPDGLALFEPATLLIESPTPLPENAIPLGWHGTGKGAYVNLIHPDPKQLVLMLSHFSGAGIGGGSVTSLLITIADMIDLQNSIIASQFMRARQLPSGPAADAALQQAFDAIKQAFYNAIEPFMRLAMSSGDLNVLRCAMQYVYGYSRQLQLLGMGAGETGNPDPELNEIDAAIRKFQTDAMRLADQLLQRRCTERRDPVAYLDVLAFARLKSLLGLPVGTIAEETRGCYPTLQLEVSSRLELKGPQSTNVGTVTAKVPLQGELDKYEVNQVSDPSKDLYASYTFSGGALGAYTATMAVPSLPAGCSITVSGTPATYKVIQRQLENQSRIKYKFFSKYEPTAVTHRGQQLCSFCPVFDKVTDRIEVLVDPGTPKDGAITTCPSNTTFSSLDWWWAAWATLQSTTTVAGDLTFVTAWQPLPSGEILATKELNRSATITGGTVSEKSTFKLVGVQQ